MFVITILILINEDESISILHGLLEKIDFSDILFISILKHIIRTFLYGSNMAIRFTQTQHGQIEQVVRVVGRSASQAVYSDQTQIGEKDQEEIRSAYLEIIEHRNWRGMIIEIAKRLQREVIPHAIPDHDFAVLMHVTPSAKHPDVREKTIEVSDQVVTIGRKYGNNLEISTHNIELSRLHCVIFALMDKLVVIDPGSLMGIKTIERSSDARKINSLPDDRHVLVFNKNESFVLELAGLRITISPKTCIICMERMRGVRFNCGHCICCADCSRYIIASDKRCPLCKKNIERVKTSRPVSTYVTYG